MHSNTCCLEYSRKEIESIPPTELRIVLARSGAVVSKLCALMHLSTEPDASFLAANTSRCEHAVIWNIIWDGEGSEGI